MNTGVLTGNLTRDPEVRFTNSGTAVCSGGLANNHKYLKGETWVDEPLFVDFTIFGKRGEAFAKHHKKGDPAIFRYRLKYETWDDKATGAKRSKLKLVVEDWEFARSSTRTPSDVDDRSKDSSAAESSSNDGHDETPF